MLKKFNSGKINTVSTHLYKYDLSGNIGNFKDYLNFYVQFAKENNQGLFLGEFSGNTDHDGNTLSKIDQGYSKSEFDSQVKAITEVTDLQLSAVWMFDKADTGYVISDSKEKDKHRFEKLQEYNKMDKTKVDSYWK